jgi:hypothetical protein
MLLLAFFFLVSHPFAKSEKEGIPSFLLQRVAEDEPEKVALKYKGLFLRKKEKEVQNAIELACRIPCSPFPGESWHQAPGIYDPGSVAVASQGSSLSHSA